MFQRKLIVI